jgi:hypothetical protein
MSSKRLPLDLSEREHTDIESLMVHAGVRTKREMVLNALALYRWAAEQVINGRSVASVSDTDGSICRFEMPGLQGFTQLKDRLDAEILSPESLIQASQDPTILATDVITEMRRLLGQLEANDAGERVARRQEPAVAGTV